MAKKSQNIKANIYGEWWFWFKINSNTEKLNSTWERLFYGGMVYAGLYYALIPSGVNFIKADVYDFMKLWVNKSVDGKIHKHNNDDSSSLLAYFIRA